jgi:hypothetical protein
MSRPRKLKWLGVSLAGVGALSLLYACALVAWQYAARLETGTWIALPASLVFAEKTGKLADIAAFLPQLPAAWLGNAEAVQWILERVHIGLPYAAAGLVLLLMGVVMVLRQNERIRLEAQAAADRLRRVRLGQYGDPADRREPYIGPSIPEVPERQRKAA